MGNGLIPAFSKVKGNLGLYLGVLITSFFLAPALAHAAGCDGAGNCYVRAAATGSGSGSDWTNAYTKLPDSLTRGVKYYVAAGSYPGHLFADPDSGSTYITVQAPTSADHGTATGWSSSYVGQAVFNTADSSAIGDIFTFQTDYYTINGVYRSTTTGQSQTDWSNEAGYGFKLDNSRKVACNADISLGDNTMTAPLPVHHITIEYVDVNGSHETSSTGCRENGFAGMWGSHDYAIQNSYIHNTGLTILFLRGQHANCTGSSGSVTCGNPGNGYGSGANIMVSSNYFNNNFSDPSQHAEGCSCSEGLQNLTFANNFWQDINGTGIIATASGADWNNGNGANGPWYIYGNVVFETSCSVYSGTKNAGVVGLLYKWDTTFTQPIYVLNNTVYNFPASCNSGSGILLNDGTYAAPATAVYVENNLWANAAGTDISNSCPSSAGYASCTSMHWGYNSYFASPDNSGANDSDSNKQVSSSAAPFVNASALNFLLTSNTMAGAGTGTLASGNNADLAGIARGANGTWDRGSRQISGSTATLKSIAITPANGSIVAGTTQQFSATGSYSDGTTGDLTNSVAWSSSNSGVVSMASSGLATGIAAGSATITATYNSVTGSTSLTVGAATLQSITVTPSNSSLMMGSTLQYTATGVYNNGTTQNLTSSAAWSSSNTAAASIGASGVATGIAAGTATIKATYGTLAGSTALTVKTVATLSSLSISPTSFSLTVGATQQMTVTGVYSDGSTQNLTSSVSWSSSSTAFATVNASGVVTGVAGGTATIKAVTGSLSVSATATVSSSTLPNPQAWWKFNEGTGWAAHDSSANATNGTLYGGANWTTGKVGYAVQSAKSGGYVSTQAVNSSTTKAITWTAWINRTYGNTSQILIENSADYNYSTTGWGFFPDDSADCGISNTIMTGVQGNVGFTLNCYKQPTSGVWHHFAAVYDKSKSGSSAVSLYIDGVLQTPVRQLSTATNTNGFNWNNVYLFSRGGKSNFATGKIQDLRIYNSALNGTQIKQVFQTGPAQ